MAINIKYRPIKAFLLAVDTGSFTHAAAQLGVTQSSFTVMIQTLEGTLDARLFERSTRAIALTPAGESFLSRIRRPIADIEDAYCSVMDSAAAQRGTVFIGVLPSVGTLVALALASLHAAVPALRARVLVNHNDDLLLALRTNQIECAVATLHTAAPDLAFQPLVEDWFCAVFKTTHPFALRKRLTWDDLAQEEMILLSRGGSRTQFDRALLRRDGASTPPRFEVSHVAMAAAFGHHGLGVALLPQLMLPEINLEGLLARRLSVSSARRSIGVVYRRDRSLTPAARQFVEHLEKGVPEIERKMKTFEGDRRPELA